MRAANVSTADALLAFGVRHGTAGRALEGVFALLSGFLHAGLATARAVAGKRHCCLAVGTISPESAHLKIDWGVACATRNRSGASGKPLVLRCRVRAHTVVPHILDRRQQQVCAVRCAVVLRFQVRIKFGRHELLQIVHALQQLRTLLAHESIVPSCTVAFRQAAKNSTKLVESHGAAG